jgi:signal transduction histidine kinase
MLRSFKLKFFILATLAILLFAIITRVSVRNTSSIPLHELFYANFASFLKLTVKDAQGNLSDHPSSPEQKDFSPELPRVKQQLSNYFPHLKSEQIQVWLSDSGADTQSENIKTAAWRKLNGSEKIPNVLMAEIKKDGQTLEVFKASLGHQSVYVSLPADVFQAQFLDIMDARESIVNSLWPLLLLYIFLCTWFLTSWVMRSLQNLENTFQKIELKEHGVRLSEKQFDREFAHFIGYFNSLIRRLQLSYEQASRFSSDAAHELRTPLTVIRGNLKRLLNRAPDHSVEQIQLSMISDEVERLISITNKLVLLSQADGDNFNLVLKEIKLFDLIAVIGEDLHTLAPHIQFEYALSPDIKLLADPSLFQQLLSNLVSNAIKYTPPQGSIQFKAKVFAGVVEFSLANTTYLSVEGLDDRVFQRFYRHLNDPSNQSQIPKGDGLGLSLCQEITHAHGGTLTLKTGPENWVTFTATWKSA